MDLANLFCRHPLRVGAQMVSAFGDELFCDICVAELNGCEECRLDAGAVGIVYLGSGVYQCYSDVVALEVLSSS